MSWSPISASRAISVRPSPGRRGMMLTEAGGGVASARGALGTDVDFHPTDVEEGGADAGRAWNVDAIQVRRRRRIAQLRVVRGSDPSNPHLDVAALVADLEAGCQFAQVGEVLNALHLEVVALESCRRSRPRSWRFCSRRSTVTMTSSI